MDYDEIRRLTITALFSDDMLLDKIVLKGGNALSLVHRLSRRTSLDVDFSIDTDFEDFEDTRQRIFRALRDRFDSVGLAVFDERLEVKPKLRGADQWPWWGGYELKFKLLPKQEHHALRNDLKKMQVRALVTGPGQQRTFKVDFSKHEFTAAKEERELDHFTIYVYSLALLAIEKLRALCQQMPEYEMTGAKTARARDFYDIHLVLTEGKVDLAAPENVGVLKTVFAFKRVPLGLLTRIAGTRDFHRDDWPAVQASVPGRLEPFDYYFDFVIEQVRRLQALGVVNPPL